MAALQHVAAAAAGPAEPERPEKDDARKLGGGAGIDLQGTADSRDSAAHAAIMEADKAFTTLRAQLAMRGFALHVIDDVCAFAVQVGARAAA